MMNSKTPLNLATASILMVFASAVSAGDLAAVLDNRFEATEEAVNSKDANAWAEAMYADDVVVVGEGGHPPVRGRDALMPVLEDIAGSVDSCSIVMNDLGTSAEQAWTFATWHCQPTKGDAYQVRALYVWEPKETGWRVVAEMYGMGSMK